MSPSQLLSSFCYLFTVSNSGLLSVKVRPVIFGRYVNVLRDRDTRSLW